MKNKMSFVLEATSHAPMIFSIFDCNPNNGIGVGLQLINSGSYDKKEVDDLKKLLLMRRQHFGDGVAVVDCGANIGVFSVEFGLLLEGWGTVTAFEAQERIFYALAGNIALNNLFNVRAIHAAVSESDGFLDIPEPDYQSYGSFGSFELRKKDNNEDIGQTIDYEKKTNRVRMVAIDDLLLERCDLIKIDVEGMEDEVVRGAWKTISARHPILCIEMIKTERQAMKN